MLHSGLDDQAAALARTMIAAFETANVDTIVINAAGCGSTMKEYGHLLRDDPAWAARAAAFSAKCKDISEILCELPSRAPRHALPMRVAYHDACHLRHAQGIHAEPRRLLATIPGIEVAEIDEGYTLLRLSRRLQPAPPRPSESTGRPQGRKPARHQGRSCHLCQSRLPAATDERAAPPRACRDARLPYGRAARRLHPQRSPRQRVKYRFAEIS